MLNKKESFYVFRNTTVEGLFSPEVMYSGYDEFTSVPKNKLLIWLYFIPVGKETNKIHELVDDYINRIEFVVNQMSDSQTLLIFTLSTRFVQFKFENVNHSIEDASEFYRKKISKLSEKDSRVKNINIDDFFNRFSTSDLIDWKFYYLSKMVVKPQIALQFKKWFHKKLDAINYKRKKCLVLDLDNTLWGGVLGEDGIDGVKLGGDYPGNAFRDFQANIKMAANAGVMLAVCSKNNIEDVQEMWAKHPENILTENDFVCIKSNWVDKAKNIAEISQELNIGLDSFVFIDDNPRERERVKTELPMVEVPEFPDQPFELFNFFTKIYSNFFQIHRLTEEDSKKTKQYKENTLRNQLKTSIGSIDEYIKNLNIELSIFINSNVSRVAQMTQKTNQFNLTTKRYSEAEINDFIENGHFIYSLGVKDKFGDNGITGAAIVLVNKENKSANIDSYLLSCRILGKNIEDIFLKYILNHLYDEGIINVIAKYCSTKKNSQTTSFYDNNSFDIIDESKEEKSYICNLNKQFKIDNKFKIVNLYGK